ncbi:MAG: rRNA pseudouridine synthase [Clostridia bacterium]|nr:rRNA pseudouridine synthase [Clostridia bacterium]
MRINKFLASCGIASRRACDKIIEEKRVTVNGRIAAMGDDVSEADDIKVDGKAVSLKKHEYYILNKPKGYLSTVSDDRGRKTVMDILGTNVGRIYPVGRLDYDSEGLLILTTDGELAQHLTHPSNEVPKTYLVKIEGTITEQDLNPIRSGIEVDGVMTKKCKAHIVETSKEYTKIHITLKEGKNREIRKMFQELGKEVVLLKRIKIGDLTLRGLSRGEFRKLTPQEVEYLKSI